jgi:serine/threonine protein kinase
LVTELLGEWNSQLDEDEETGRAFQWRYDESTRRALDKFRGSYLHQGDPTSLVFGDPVNAVCFALEYQQSLRAIAQDLNLDLSWRAGIHGTDRTAPEAASKSHSATSQADPTRVESIAEKIKSLALNWQTLLTGPVFEKVHPQSDNSGLPTEIVWLEHGEYRIEGVTDSIRIFEVGIPGHSPLRPPEDTEQVRRLSSPSPSGTLLGGEESMGVEVTKKVHTQRLEKSAAVDEKYGEYQVIRELGKGGFGTVYLAVNPLSPDMKFALKVFKDTSGEGGQTSSLLSDLRPMLLLAHPHIVKVCGFGSSKIQGQIQVWMAMTYVEGPMGDSFDLKKYLKTKGKLSPQEVKRIFSQILAALVHVHESFYAHLDLKPQNVLLDKSYRAFLADFGISKSVSEDSLKVTEAQPIEALSPEYASPEQLFERTGTRHSDVYSAGVMILECLTGKRPKELIEIIRYGNETKVEFKPPSSFGIDASWDKLIARCLRPNPVDRYKDAGALLEALRSIKVGEEKKLAISLSAVSMSVVGLLLGYYFFIREAPPPDEPRVPADANWHAGLLELGEEPPDAPDAPIQAMGRILSATPTPTQVLVASATPALAPLLSATTSATWTWTPEPSLTATFTPVTSDTFTLLPPSPTGTATETMVPTSTPSVMPTPTDTIPLSPTPTHTEPPTPTATYSASLTPTQTPSRTPTPSDTPSSTPSITFTGTATATPSSSPTTAMIPALSPPTPVDPQAEEQALQRAKSIAEAFFRDINNGQVPKVYESEKQDQNLSLNRLIRQTKNSRGEPQVLTVREVKWTEYGSLRVGFSKDPAQSGRKYRISGKPTIEWCELFVREGPGGAYTVYRVTLD